MSYYHDDNLLSHASHVYVDSVCMGQCGVGYSSSLLLYTRNELFLVELAIIPSLNLRRKSSSLQCNILKRIQWLPVDCRLQLVLTLPGMFCRVQRSEVSHCCYSHQELHVLVGFKFSSLTHEGRPLFILFKLPPQLRHLLSLRLSLLPWIHTQTQLFFLLLLSLPPAWFMVLTENISSGITYHIVPSYCTQN